MEEYLVSEVERFEELVASIIEEVGKKTASLNRTRAKEKTEEILHRYLVQFIESISLPEPVLTALKWRFRDKLEKELQFKENLDSFWRGEPLNQACQSIKGKYPSILDRLRTPREDSLELLPLGSWFLSLRIKLKKPYVGKDDGEVHVQDNPICRDKVFQPPFIRSTTVSSQ